MLQGNRHPCQLADKRHCSFSFIVIHLAAASFVRAALPQAGSAAANTKTSKHYAFKQFGDGAGYKVVPMTDGSLGRFGKVAAHFVSKLCDVAALHVRTFMAAFMRTVEQQELSCAVCWESAQM